MSHKVQCMLLAFVVTYIVSSAAAHPQPDLKTVHLDQALLSDPSTADELLVDLGNNKDLDPASEGEWTELNPLQKKWANSKFSTWGKRWGDSKFNTWGKKRWGNSKFNTWGKRWGNSKFNTWGKRNDNENNENNEAEKRWGSSNFNTWGKRADDPKRQWHQFMTWGKRSGNNWSGFSTWGKRGGDWKFNTWGKRADTATGASEIELALKQFDTDGKQ